MPHAIQASKAASRTAASPIRGGSSGHALDQDTTSTILELQALAGNRAVTALLQRDKKAGAAADPPPAAGAGSPTPPPATTAAAPPTEGKPVEHLGIVENDTEGGGGLNLRATPEGAVLTRMAFNDHVMVKTDVGNDWFYVIAVDGAAKGTAGYASRKYLNLELPPSRDNPDPQATLYRVQGGERAHEVVRQHYGADNIVAGQDQRFFTNVLEYVNQDAGRGRFFRKVMKVRKGSGGFWGSVATPYEDTELVAGGKIWIPSLPFAQALKGTVSAGSFARDTWEKVKDIGSKLVAIPAFIAGLVVGALESVRDLVVGLFEMIWGIIKSLGGILIDMARAIWGLITDPTKRQALMESLDTQLTEMLYKGSTMKRAYNWGRIVGYATMEVVTFILLAGAAVALKAGKFGTKLGKVFEVLKQSESIQKAIKGAEALRKTETVTKIVSTVEKAAAVGGKVLDKAKPVTDVAKKAAKVVGKVLDAPGKATLGTAKVLTRGLRKLAAKYGWSESRFAKVLGIIEERGATVYLRPSSKWAPARLAEGALPKPIQIKANTLDELDLILSNGQFTKKDLGLVAHYEPVPAWSRPKDIPAKRWEAMQPQLEAKYRKRLASYYQNEKDMAKYAIPNGSRDTTYFEVKGGNKVKGGLVYQVDVDDVGKVTRHPLSGDIDVFEFKTKAGKTSGAEYRQLDDLFLEAGATEHGGHLDWRNRGDLNQDAFFGIIEGHLKDPVVEIGPGGKVRTVTADHVPGVSEILNSPEYKAWKAKKSGTAPTGSAGGGGSAPPPAGGSAGGAKTQGGGSTSATKASTSAAGAAGDHITVYHGTGDAGLKGGAINVKHTGGAHQDLGQGFYLTTDPAVAKEYAAARGKGGGKVIDWTIPKDKLGVIVDIRPGGNFSPQWEAYLERTFAGGMVPGMPNNRMVMMKTADIRGRMFDDFLAEIGQTKADTIIAQVGPPPFTGIGSGTQISIRSQAVADALNVLLGAGR